jgi:hypothetical protein
VPSPVGSAVKDLFLPGKVGSKVGSAVKGLSLPGKVGSKVGPAVTGLSLPGKVGAEVVAASVALIVGAEVVAASVVIVVGNTEGSPEGCTVSPDVYVGALVTSGVTNNAEGFAVSSPTDIVG